MLKIAKDIKKIRALFGYGSKLLLLRLRVLQLDAREQAPIWQKMAIFFTLICIFFLFSLIALLFALNSMLPEYSKVWVFLAISGASLIFVVYLVKQLPTMWTNSTTPISQTLNDIQQDFLRISNQMQPENDGEQVISSENESSEQVIN